MREAQKRGLKSRAKRVAAGELPTDFRFLEDVIVDDFERSEKRMNGLRQGTPIIYAVRARVPTSRVNDLLSDRAIRKAELAILSEAGVAEPMPETPVSRKANLAKPARSMNAVEKSAALARIAGSAVN